MIEIEKKRLTTHPEGAVCFHELLFKRPEENLELLGSTLFSLEEKDYIFTVYMFTFSVLHRNVNNIFIVVVITEFHCLLCHVSCI